MNRDLPTLLMVANRAGVSKATASMALRGDIRIRPETRARVEKAAKELDYVPDPVLSALSVRRHRVGQYRALANLAVVIDDHWYDMSKTSNIKPIWLEMELSGMEDAAKRMGYALTRFFLRRDLMSHKHPDKLFANLGIWGVILAPFIREEFALPLDLNRYSVLGVGNFHGKYSIHRVGFDSFAAIELACQKLSEAGYRRIGLAHSLHSELRSRYEWLGSFAKEAFLKRYKFDLLPPYLPEVFTEKGVHAWIAKYRPEAMITNDLPFYNAALGAGLNIPNDLGIVFINREVCGVPNASGIEQHFHALGESAVEQIHLLLLKGERGTTEQPHETLIYPSWGPGKTILSRRDVSQCPKQSQIPQGKQ